MEQGAGSEWDAQQGSRNTGPAYPSAEAHCGGILWSVNCFFFFSLTLNGCLLCMCTCVKLFAQVKKRRDKTGNRYARQSEQK